MPRGELRSCTKAARTTWMTLESQTNTLLGKPQLTSLGTKAQPNKKL